MRFLGKPTVLVRALDQIKLLLNSDEDLTEVAWPPATLAMLGPNSVTFARGAYHRSLRRLLGPCFAPQAIESYLPAIQSLCERYCAAWADASAAAGPSQLGLLPKLQKEARQLTFEVMAHVVAGFRFSPQQLARLSDAFDDFMRGIFFPVAVAIPGSPFTKALAARKLLVRALDEQIDAFTAAAAAAAAGGAQQQQQANGAGCGDGGSSTPSEGSVIERLLGMRGDDGRPLSRVALQDISVGMLFAGHETTASTLLRMMLRLRSRPDVVSKLRAEQAAAVADHGHAVTGAALRDMPYLDAVVKETWRVDPLVPLVVRRARRTFSLGGYDVPQGWSIFLGLSEPVKELPAWRGLPASHPLHPAAFNPDRWLLAPPPAPAAAAAAAAAAEEPGPCPEPGAALPPGCLASPLGMLPAAMLTFGGGNRYCLGANLAWAELKTFLCVLVRRYDFSAPLEAMRVQVFPTLTISEGFPIRVRPHAEAVAAA